jgi:hypothetical protein
VPADQAVVIKRHGGSIPPIVFVFQRLDCDPATRTQMQLVRGTRVHRLRSSAKGRARQLSSPYKSS